MGSRVADVCHEYLRPKRKPRSVLDLYTQLAMEAYTAFTEGDLLMFLKSEGRFIVEGETPWGSGISVQSETKNSDQRLALALHGERRPIGVLVRGKERKSR